MGFKVNFDLAKFKEELKEVSDKINAATRPVAQVGAQIVYDRARQIVAANYVSKRPHKFHIEGRVYGPYKPWTLYHAIYQAFSKDNSYSDATTYHISWNADKAPYGAMVEFGGSQEMSQSFIRRALKETRSLVRKEMKKRFIEEVNK